MEERHAAEYKYEGPGAPGHGPIGGGPTTIVVRAEKKTTVLEQEPTEQTIEALDQVSTHLRELHDWLRTSGFKLDPVYAMRLRVVLAQARDRADEAWQSEARG